MKKYAIQITNNATGEVTKYDADFVFAAFHTEKPESFCGASATAVEIAESLIFLFRQTGAFINRQPEIKKLISSYYGLDDDDPELDEIYKTKFS